MNSEIAKYKKRQIFWLKEEEKRLQMESRKQISKRVKICRVYVGIMSYVRVQAWVERWDFLIGVEQADDEDLYQVIMIIRMDIHSE